MNIAYSTYKKKVLILIAALGILRLILAFTVELTNDESYYWFYSQHLKLNYFDHPPMIAFWIRICTLNLWLQDYIGFIRLSSVISCCLATWLMYKCVAALSGERAGFVAAFLYNASFYSGVTAGIYAMPDSPQMIFWSLSLYMIVCITQHENSWKYWLLFGIAGGLCIMSKLHGLFIWIGMGGYVLFYNRKWLRNIKLYAALITSIIICLPILFWNIKYNFVTYKFNGPRIDIYDAAHNWIYFRNEISAHVFYTNPVNFILIAAGLFALKKQFIPRLPALTVFSFTGVPFALFLLIISIYKPTLAHWSGPAYITLLPVAAIYADKQTRFKPVTLGKLSLGLHIIVLLACVWIIYYFPQNFGVASGKFLGMNDRTLDMYGWKQAGEKFDSLYIAFHQQNKIPPQTPLVCNEWGGAHVEYYFCRPLNIKMIGLNNIMEIHEYMWMNGLRKDSVNMNHAFCIIPSDRYYNPNKAYKDYYQHADSITTIQTFRAGKPAHNFYVYYLSGWKGILPVMK